MIDYSDHSRICPREIETVWDLNANILGRSEGRS